MDAVLRTFDDHLRRVEAGEARLMVAEQDGVAVGVCSLEWRAPFWTAETHAWLPDLVVTESARGRGIGTGAAGRRHGRRRRGTEQRSSPWNPAGRGRRHITCIGPAASARPDRPTDCCGPNGERLPATPADRAARIDRAGHRERAVAVRRRPGDGRPAGATHPGAAARRSGWRGLLELPADAGFDVWQDGTGRSAFLASHLASRSWPSSSRGPITTWRTCRLTWLPNWDR